MKYDSLMPRNQRGRAYERVGHNIRDFAGVSLKEPLDPFALAKFMKIRIVAPSKIPRLSPLVLAELIGRSSSQWSAATIVLPGGWKLCILNPTHTIERMRASLMEEISHVILGHKPTRILMPEGGVACREYNAPDEEVAYGVGAAALVPYAALFMALRNGEKPESIAASFGVSLPLVLYRIKITLLWPLYRTKAS